jgi:hypothetical protein
VTKGVLTLRKEQQDAEATSTEAISPLIHSVSSIFPRGARSARANRTLYRFPLLDQNFLRHTGSTFQKPSPLRPAPFRIRNRPLLASN